MWPEEIKNGPKYAIPKIDYPSDILDITLEDADDWA